LAIQTESSILHKEIQALTMMNEELNNALESVEEKHRQEIDEVYQELTSLRNLLTVESQEKSKLLADFAEPMHYQQLYMQLQDDHEHVLQMLQESHMQCQTKEETFQVLQKTYEDSLAENVKLQQQIDQLQHELEKKDQISQELTNQLTITTTNVEDHVQILSERESFIKQTTQQMIELKRSLSEYEHQHHALSLSLQDYDTVKEKYKQQNEKLDFLEKEIQHKHLELIAMKSNEESQKLTITRLESLIHEQQHFIGDLNQCIAQHEDFKMKHTEVSMQLVILQDECSRLKMEREQQEREIQRMKSFIESMEEDRKIRIKDHEQHLLEKAMEVEKLKNQVNKGYSDADSLVSAVF
jgi:chromosome segregation ATPase